MSSIKKKIIRPPEVKQLPQQPTESTSQYRSQWGEAETRKWLEAIGYPTAALQAGSLNGTYISYLVQLAQTSDQQLIESLVKEGVQSDQAKNIIGKLKGASQV